MFPADECRRLSAVDLVENDDQHDRHFPEIRTKDAVETSGEGIRAAKGSCESLSSLKKQRPCDAL